MMKNANDGQTYAASSIVNLFAQSIASKSHEDFFSPRKASQKAVKTSSTAKPNNRTFSTMKPNDVSKECSLATLGLANHLTPHRQT